MGQIPMYDESKRQWYFDAYQKTDDEKIYACYEFCVEDGTIKSVCTPDNSVKIIEQPQNKMVFYDGDLYGKNKPVLFHKSAGGANHWTFGRLEKDHGRIAINKDGATATFTIEGTTFKCKLKNQKLMEN